MNHKQNVTFPSGTGNAYGYLALPSGGSGPGVLVIQEWWGLTTHIADMTDRLAEAGYVALAPDLYGGATTHDAAEARELMRALPVERAVADLRGAVDFLLDRDEVTGTRVGAVGFCMGGGFVLTLAARDPERIGAAVPFYGLPPDDVDLSRLRSPVLGHYAERDDTIPLDAVHRLADRIKAAGSEITLHVYPAGHAFCNDENPRGNHDPEQAALAWTRTLEFLGRRLRHADR